MTDKLYLITEAQRDNYLQIMRNNMQDPDAYDTIAELQSLPMVDREPVAHMYPWDLDRFATSETTGHAYSVAVGCHDGKSVPLYTSPQALADRGIAETCAEICRSRSRSISADGHNAAAANEASKCALAIESHWQTYPSKALTPITADDVTDEMINDCLPHWMMSSISDVREIFVQIYNAVIKHRGETR